MRSVIYLLSLGQLLFLMAMTLDVALTSTDAAGQSMAFGLLMAGYMIVAACVLPAVILARSENWQWLGVPLAVAPVLVALAVFAL
ncbi:hypothetical protein QEZ52_17600 [Aliisedimentitalea scapharcae]|uniref:Uncharacterized protein n=1 Tax=Aliisedimentitalea scapharcae TaxID=1524259 RepID=A0ABZ2XUA4_9RHOB|nr:hypothetical protein K3727_17980 [Rhodobacteraceae bacterium M382]